MKAQVKVSERDDTVTQDSLDQGRRARRNDRTVEVVSSDENVCKTGEKRLKK